MWWVRLLEIGDGGGLGVVSCGDGKISGGIKCGFGNGVGVVMVFALAFVDCMLARFACMWPFSVAVRSGGHRRSCLTVMGGKVVR